jgi:hypothetical protein
MVPFLAQELPAPEVAAFARMTGADGHLCVACGTAHGNCCGLCPHWRPLPGEGSRGSRIGTVHTD